MIRSMARQIAKATMKKVGLRNICGRDGKRNGGRSYFANHWREFVMVNVR